jgi:hypothetical protein
VSLLSDIASLKTRVTTVERRTTSVEAKNAAQGNSRAALDSRATNLQKEVDALKYIISGSSRLRQLSFASSSGRLNSASVVLNKSTPTGNYYNVVTQGGAHGDGVTDDTAHILAAITAYKAAGKSGLYFPAGTYALASTLTVPNSTVLVGVTTAARNPTPGNRTSANRLAGCVLPTSWLKGRVDFGSNSAFSDLKIGDDNGKCGLYHVNNASTTTFTRCQFRGGGGTTPVESTTVKFGDGLAADHVIFTDCNIERALSNGVGNNVSVTEFGNSSGGHLEYITFNRCHFGVSNGDGGHDWGAGRANIECYVYRGAGSTSSTGAAHGWNNVSITDCVLEASTSFSVDFACAYLTGSSPVISSASYGVLTGCLLKGAGYGNSASFGYNVCAEAPHHCTISSNEMWRAYRECFDIVDTQSTPNVYTKDFVISNNNCLDYSEDSIVPGGGASYCYRALLYGTGTFSGNTITTSVGNGSLWLRTTGATITGNTFIETRGTVPTYAKIAIVESDAMNNVITGNIFRNTTATVDPIIGYGAGNSGNSDIPANNTFQHA